MLYSIWQALLLGRCHKKVIFCKPVSFVTCMFNHNIKTKSVQQYVFISLVVDVFRFPYLDFRQKNSGKCTWMIISVSSTAVKQNETKKEIRNKQQKLLWSIYFCHFLVIVSR